MRSTVNWLVLSLATLVVGCGAEEEKGSPPQIVEVVEVGTSDVNGALLDACASIVGRCEKSGAERIVVVPRLYPDELQVFACDGLVQAREGGCRHVPAGVGLRDALSAPPHPNPPRSEDETGQSLEQKEKTAHAQQAQSASEYFPPAPLGPDFPSYTPIGPGSGSGWGDGWRNDPQYSGYFATPDPNLNKMRKIVADHERDRIREENRRRALAARSADSKPRPDPATLHDRIPPQNKDPQPPQRPWYAPDLGPAKELAKTLWYTFKDENAIPGPGQSTENVACKLACADGISLTCAQVQDLCSTVDNIGFNFGGKPVVITCAGLRPLACIVAPVFSGPLCEVTLCSGF